MYMTFFRAFRAFRVEHRSSKRICSTRTRNFRSSSHLCSTRILEQEIPVRLDPSRVESSRTSSMLDRRAISGGKSHTECRFDIDSLFIVRDFVEYTYKKIRDER